MTCTICCMCDRFWITTGRTCSRPIMSGERGLDNPLAHLHISEKRFRAMNWKKIWCGICAAGRRTSGRFGLLVLELHTLPPQLTAANLGKTPAVAYDGTHGFSDQYLVELPVFLNCAREAGLHADPRYQCRFPASELATVSINFFTAAAPSN